MSRGQTPNDWVTIDENGLYIRPGGFYIDPFKPVQQAVISHGHADHARPGHGRVYATPETLAIMRTRYNDQAGDDQVRLAYYQSKHLGDVKVTLIPAGHVLGSAQIVMEYAGKRMIYSGDFKRGSDPTCTGFDVSPCDVFITEATFGLPVFRHPPVADEIGKLMDSLATFPDRPHLIGCYPLGKTQRLIKEIRNAGYAREIYIHGALQQLISLYESQAGMDFGELVHVRAKAGQDYRGAIVFCPPSALQDKWARRFDNPVVCMASGWMRVRQRAKQRGVELPLIVSDHADWDALTQTMHDVGAEEIWVTHGREDALVHYARQHGFRARALSLVGLEDESLEEA
jgi:putative mRNA 3-end processing factor